VSTKGKSQGPVPPVLIEFSIDKPVPPGQNSRGFWHAGSVGADIFG
jgi:hypothetical protein